MPIAPAFAQAPANGNTPPTTLSPAQMQQMQEMQAKIEAYQEAAQRMETHIHLGRDKLLHLDVKSGEEIGVDPGIFAQLKAALEHTDDLLLERQISIGEVAFSNNRNIFGREVALQRVDGNSIEGFGTPGLNCAGWTGVRWYWGGPEFYINECWTQGWITLLEGGYRIEAVATTVAKALGKISWQAAAWGGVAYSVTNLGAWGIDKVDAWGGRKGIRIKTYWCLPNPTNPYPVRFGWLWYQ